MTTVQSMDVTATTGPGGFFTTSFDSPVDQVVVSATRPQSSVPGADRGLVSATAQLTGARSAQVRVWRVDATGTGIEPAGSQQVTVTLIGVTH